MAEAFQVYDFRYVSGYLLVVSVLTLFSYRSDKKSAADESWRIPEIRLHAFELAGGWMIAYWAQRIFRHKIRKVSYQVGFWAIGVFHQYLAYDYLHGWKGSQKIMDLGKMIFSSIQPYLQ